MKNSFFIIYSLLMLLTYSSCSEKDDVKEPTTLTLTEESIDFKSGSDNKTIKIRTNAENWSASVDAQGKDWCTATPRISASDNSLEIEVSENNNRDVRETSITVSATGVESKTIKVRQLGYDAAILVSTSIFTVDQIGGSISFQVTTNVDNFKFICNDWISEKSTKASAVEMITTDHFFSIKVNGSEQQRTGTIVVQDLDSELNTPVTIVQKGMGNYVSADLDGIKDDIKKTVTRGEASSYQSGSGIEKSFDGDYSTLYHSNWTNTSSDYFPITLTYYFNNEDIDYLVYYPRTSGYNGYFMEAEIQAQYNGDSSFKKVLDKNFGASSSATRVSFDETLTKTTAIRFILKNGYGDGNGFASCSEMEFYEKNPENFNPLELFSDVTCSELKPGITEDNIEACVYPFYKKIAYYLYANKYPKDFRIAEFKAYPHPSIQSNTHKTNPYSLLDNPTGISVAEGENLIVFAGNLKGQNISIRIQNLDVPGGDGFGGISYPIVEGFNKIKMQTKGLVYVMYHTPDFEKAEPIKLHFATGSVNGYYDVAKHKASDWSNLLNAATDKYFDVVGKYAHITFPVSRFKENTPDGQALIDIYDEIVRLEMDFMGLYKYNKVFNNRLYCNVMYHSYMYATSYHTAYNDETLTELTNVNRLKTGSIWGPAHEIGHCNQTRPGLLWAGTTEVTNNIHSLYVQTSFGNVSRIQGEDLSSTGYTNRYEKAMNSIIVKNIAHGNEDDVFCKLVPFWQLQLYCSNVIGNEDFYKDIYEDIRQSANVSDYGQNQLDFVLRCCNSAKLNLLDFFTKWGFLTPIDVEIDDYGVKTLRITQAMIDKLIADVEAKNYSKPELRIEYITDNNASVFSTISNIIVGTATANGKKISMTNWKNVVAYEVYNDDKLSFVSPEKSFTLNSEFTSNTKVYAVSAKGDKIEVTF